MLQSVVVEKFMLIKTFLKQYQREYWILKLLHETYVVFLNAKTGLESDFVGNDTDYS